MKLNNASTITQIKQKIAELLKDKSDLDQMEKDVQSLKEISNMVLKDTELN